MNQLTRIRKDWGHDQTNLNPPLPQSTGLPQLCCSPPLGPRPAPSPGTSASSPVNEGRVGVVTPEVSSMSLSLTPTMTREGPEHPDLGPQR